MSIEINRAFLRTLCEEIDAALADIGKEYGLEIKAGNATYTSSTFGLKIEGKVEGGVEGGADLDAQRYDSSRELMQLPPRGTAFVYGGKTYTTQGLNTTGSKVHVARVPDGKQFVISPDAVRRAIANPNTTPFVRRRRRHMED